MRFVGGYTYRFKYADGSHKDYVFAGTNGNHTIWRSGDGIQVDEDIFKGAVEVFEHSKPDRAVNESR